MNSIRGRTQFPNLQMDTNSGNEKNFKDKMVKPTNQQNKDNQFGGAMSMFSKKQVRKSSPPLSVTRKHELQRETPMEEWRSELFSWVCVYQTVQSWRTYLFLASISLPRKFCNFTCITIYDGGHGLPQLQVESASVSPMGGRCFHFQHQKEGSPNGRPRQPSMRTHDCHQHEAIC